MSGKIFSQFENIYIEEKFKNNINVEKILSRVTGKSKISYVDDITKLMKILPQSHPNEVSKNLLLSGIRGDVLRKCPGTNGHICCNYYVINLYVGCPLGCTYCILQSYLNQPLTIINLDIDSIFLSLDKIFKENNKKFFRVGTGELGDSLVYDHLTDYSTEFIDFFAGYKNTIFEFKTKTTNVSNLLQKQSPGNVVVGFSVNPSIVSEKEETYASKIEDRISCAKELVSKGYKIALHFDPLINIENFENEYSILIDNIFKNLSPKNIAWISLGTFRYTPDLKICIEYNYPKTKILCEEFIVDRDKKFRYFKTIRIELYKKIIDKLKSINDNLTIYLCMESKEVWKKTLGFLPFDESKVDLIFKNAVNL
ncbi:MAG TPA: radical SAM protein [Spirochaetota bacterium]|nr:radical SAM protein [Spirochaetota bacterium]